MRSSKPTSIGSSAAEEDPALGRDQLVGPREIRGLGRDPEDVLAEPLPSPRPGQEGRPRAERLPGELVQRLPEASLRRASAASPARSGRRRGRVAAGASCLCRSSTGQSTKSSRCSEPGSPTGWPRLPASPRRIAGQSVSLRDVGVPEHVVLDERAAGAEADDELGRRVHVPAAARRGGRRARRRRRGRRRDRPGSTLAAVRRWISSHGASKRRASTSSVVTLASVELLARDARGSRPTAAPPARRSRALRGAARTDGVGQRGEPALDSPSVDRIARTRGRSSPDERNRRSSVSAALQEKSPLPSGSPLLGS